MARFSSCCLIFVAIILHADCVFGTVFDEWMGFDVPPPLTEEEVQLLKDRENQHRIQHFGDHNLTVMLDLEKPNNLPIPSERRLNRISKLLTKARVFTESLPEAGNDYLGRVTTIKRILEDAVDIMPEVQETWIELGNHLCTYGRQEQDIKRAVASFAFGLEKNPSNATAVRMAGQCLWNVGLHLEAINFFQKAADLDSTIESWHYLCTSTKHRLGSKAAVECFERACLKFPSEEGLQMSLSAGYLHLGDMPHAVEILKKTVALNPQSAHAHKQLGVTYWYTKNFTGSVEHLKTASKLSPKDALIKSFYGQALRFSDMEEEAVTQFREAEAMDKWKKKDQRPIQLYPGLSAKPWYSSRKFAFTKDVENSIDIIADEIKSAESQFLDRDAPVIASGHAKTLILLRQGTGQKSTCDLLPKTCEILFNITDVKAVPGYVHVTIYDPNTIVFGTTSQTNICLRMDLPIQVGQKSSIRVGDDRRELHVGRSVVYDPSFDHDFKNGNEKAIILSVEFFHHELEKPEDRNKAIHFAASVE